MSKRSTALIVGAGAAAAAAIAARRRRRPPHAPLAVLEGGEHRTFTTSDGAELAVHIAGDGPTIVLSHCWTGDMRVWEPVAAKLVAGGHRVVRYDQRGHGRSTMGADGHAIERLGQDLAELLTELDVRDAVVAGHSLGGMSAQALAIHHPDVAGERVRALVLVSTAARNQVSLDMRLLELVLGDGVADRVLGTRYGHAFVRGALGRGAHPQAVRITRDTFVGTPGAVRVGQGRALLEMDLEAAGEKIEQPTTILVGTRDTLTPVDRARGLAATIPDARLHVLPGLGHMLPLEAVDDVAAHIAAAAR